MVVPIKNSSYSLWAIFATSIRERKAKFTCPPDPQSLKRPCPDYAFCLLLQISIFLKGEYIIDNYGTGVQEGL